MATEIVEFLDDEPPQPPPPPRLAARWREVLSVVAFVVLVDLTIYRGEGFAGLAVFLAIGVVLTYVGAAIRQPARAASCVAVLILITAAALEWCGNGLAVACGCALLAAFAMAVNGGRPFVLETIAYVAEAIPGGVAAWVQYGQAGSKTRISPSRGKVLAYVIPVMAICAFGLLFTLANPDLFAWVSEEISIALRNLQEWVVKFAPPPLEIALWGGTAWLAAGLLRPLRYATAISLASEDRPAPESTEPADAPLYEAFRNTLAVLVVFFVVYLAFEFSTLWFREFPEGFHYSGYAHEGAFWLTVALALATFLLSVIFQGRILHDPRLSTLKRWAGVWAVLNLTLGLAVYNRLWIYVGFNGMTRMRTVGFLGTSAVIVGFLLVLRKIAKGRSFVWLIRRDLWTLAGFIWLYAVLPVDLLVMRYNTARILDGDPRPCVQISVHPIRSDGLLMLIPLLDCDDPMIQSGVRALLAEWLDSKRTDHWSAYQIADRRLERQLAPVEDRLARYIRDVKQRAADRERFDSYAYQWY